MRNQTDTSDFGYGVLYLPQELIGALIRQDFLPLFFSDDAAT
jgi:hypothetical protein